MPRKKPGIEVRENADGSKTYRIRWRQGSGRAGRNLSHSFDRQNEAIDARNRIMASGSVCYCPKHAPDGVEPTMHFGASPPPAPAAAGESAGPTFGEFAAQHVELLTGIGPGYRARFRREIEMHFAPFLDRPLGAISEGDVKLWIRGLEEGTHPWLLRQPRGADGRVPHPLSPTTIRRLLAQSGAVLAAAQAEGHAVKNPFRGHRLGRRDRDQHTEMTVLTHEEFARLLDAVPAGVYRDLVAVMAGTGMRWGEATALGPAHVDPFAAPPVLHVARAWQDDGSNGYQLGTPKSRRSRRTINFSAAVLEALIPHLSTATEFVFTTPGGKPLRHSNFYNRVWLPAVSRFAGDVYDRDGKLVKRGTGKRPRIHDLRHTYASWLISGGMDIAAVSRRLGHETTALTVDTYYHLLPKTESDALAILEAAMPSTRPEGA